MCSGKNLTFELINCLKSVSIKSETTYLMWIKNQKKNNQKKKKKKKKKIFFFVLVKIKKNK
jgi:hypothetical protein